MFELTSFRVSLLVLVVSIAAVWLLDSTELDRQRRGAIPQTFRTFRSFFYPLFHL